MRKFRNLNSSMDTETIQKNEAIPKSQMSRRNFKSLLQLCVCAIFCAYFSISCSTPKTYILSVEGGSKADGIILLSMVYGGELKFTIDWEDAQRKATERCKNWGYNGAELMNVPKIPYEGCKVIFKYQCTECKE